MAEEDNNNKCSIKHSVRMYSRENQFHIIDIPERVLR